MKNKSMLWFLMFVSLIIGGTIIDNRRVNELEKNFVVTSGWVTGKSTSKSGHSTIDYFFKIDDKKIRGSSIGGSTWCQWNAKDMSNFIKGLQMPIVYEKGKPENNQILIFKKEYAKFGVKVPEELREVVEEMSKCE